MWLIELLALKALEKAEASGFEPSAAQMARLSANSSTLPLTLSGDVATIDIKGVLTPRPDIIAMIFGGGNTTYETIRAAIAEAEADSRVERIEFNIDSPGGTIAGLFDTIAAMEAIKKPTVARVDGMAASAAFALATQADEIVAMGPAAQFGSVGIVQAFRVDDSIVEITSSNAPNKRPDPTTDEGQAVIREHLDALHDLFVDAIASGREKSTDDVNSEFGRGGVVLAGEAVKRGMIDRVEKPSLRAVSTANSKTADSGGSTPEAIMDLNQLKADHPAVYAAAVKVGSDEERDRVMGHLELGKQTGAMDIATTAIESGDGMTATLTAKYIGAGLSNKDMQARDDDDQDADAGSQGEGDLDEKGMDVDAVFAATRENMGLEA